MNDFQMYEEGRKEAENEQCNISIVSVSFFQHLEMQLKYHKEKENERAACRDYREAMYHNHRGGAIEDLIIKIKNER